MKTREEVIKDLKPSKMKYVIIIIVWIAECFMLVSIFFSFSSQYEQEYQALIEGNYDEETLQKELTDLEEQKQENIKIVGIMALASLFALGVFYVTLFCSKSMRDHKKLIKSIEDGTARMQNAKITSFRYEVQDHNNSTSYGYHVLVENDQHQVFESDFLSNAKVYDTTGEEIVSKEQNLFSLIKTAYQTYKNTDNTEDVHQTILQEIKERENPDAWKMEHLIYQEQTYHIGDVVEVYLHPDDAQIYYVSL